MKKLGMYDVSVTIPKAVAALEFRCGVVGPFGPDVDPDELQELLSEHYQGITVERIMKGRDENKTKTTQIKLKFKAKELPEYNHVLYERFKVRQYIDQPWQCFNCQGFGHSAHNCTRKTKCLVCAGEHRLKDCTQKDKNRCANCKGNHVANSPECARMQKEKEVQRTRCMNHISYSEALKKVKGPEQVRDSGIDKIPIATRTVKDSLDRIRNKYGLRQANNNIEHKDMATQTLVEEGTSTADLVSIDSNIASDDFKHHTEKQAAFLLDIVSAASQTGTLQKNVMQ